MKDDKLDKILDHLYGELEPETEEDFLNEVSSSKLLSNRLTETRKLLTAYRLAPTMEIARDSAENALERLRTARAAEAAAVKAEEASMQLPEPEIEPTATHATETIDSEQIAEPVTPLSVDSATRKKPSNLGLISTAAIIILGIGVGYYLFNNTQPESSQTLNNELELTFIEPAASNLTAAKTIAEKKNLNKPSNSKATPTTIPELSPEALATNKAEENFEEIQDILEEIDEISLSRPTEELTVIDRSDSVELEESDIDLLDISNIEPLPEMDSEAPDLETEFNQMLPEIEEPTTPLLPKHADIDLAHDTQSSENTVESTDTPKTTVEELEKQKEAARLAEIEKQKEAARLAEIEKQKEAERLAEIEKQKEAARLAKIEKLKEAARLAEIEKQKEAARLAELEKQKEAARLAEIEKQKEAARLAEIEKQKEAARLAEIEKQKEAARLAEIEKQKEAARLAEIEKQKEAARLAEIEKQKEAARLAEIEKQKEAARLAEIEKQKEAARLAEIEKQKEAARLAEIEKQKEAARLAEIKKQKEAARLAEIEKQKEVARLAELEKQQETARLAEIEKQKEAARLAEIKKQKEAARLAELEKQQEAARLAEIEKQKEAARLAETVAKKEIKIVEPITLSENNSIHSVDDLPVMPLSEDDNQPLAILINPETTSKEKITFETADSVAQLIQKAEALYLKKSYLQALFGVEEALLQAVSRQDRISALTLKARIELQLKSFAEMQETISTLRPLSPLDASALQVLYNAALNHEKLTIQREQQAAHYYTPTPLNSTSNTEYQANTPRTTSEDTSNTPNPTRKKRFNPTTDTYYKRR